MQKTLSFTDFLCKEVEILRKGGLPLLLRKIHIFLFLPMLAKLAIPTVLVVRALRPLVHIRFGQLRSDRIGHFATNTELYLCKRDAGMDAQRTFDIFCYERQISNQQLRKMWERKLHFPSFACSLYMANKSLPGFADYTVPSSDSKDINGLLASTKTHLSFTPEEECIGDEVLQKLGIPKGALFVCFHSRDSAYLETVLPDENWDYHNYGDSSIGNYVPAVEKLAEKGYYLIRMGAIVKEPLKTNNPRIIDYAKNGRNDFMDIFLCAKCRFFIGSPTGLTEIPMIFRKSIAWVNIIPLEMVHAWCPNDLFIFKKLWLQKERRFLTIREILNSGAGRFFESGQYEQVGIEPIENTPEEITALVIEMDERLKGTWQTTKEDEQLQQRFWSLFEPNDFNQIFVSRIGTEFLRQNRQLLE